MSTTITPPPVPPMPSETPSPPRSPRASSRVIAILTIALGAALVVGTLTSSAFSTVAAASVTTDARAVEASGVESLVTDLSAGSLRIEFADVTEAELDVTSAFGAGQWTLERNGDELRVASPDWRWGFAWPFRGGNGSAVLRLPESLEGLDASLQMSAGELAASGDFGEVDLDIGAGRARLDGSATELSVDLSAGGADLDLAGVRTADLTVSAGTMDASLTDRRPEEITIDVSAGSLDLSVPEGDYDVTSEVSAGGFDNRIGSTPGAENTVDVQVSAGSATLRSSSSRR